jgi:hypothetical protein
MTPTSTAETLTPEMWQKYLQDINHDRRLDRSNESWESHESGSDLALKYGAHDQQLLPINHTDLMTRTKPFQQMTHPQGMQPTQPANRIQPNEPGQVPDMYRSNPYYTEAIKKRLNK